MFSYRYHTMIMQGLKNGWKKTSSEDVLFGYNIVPEKMNMHMHMLGMMVGVSDRITLSWMMPFVFNQMLHLTKSGPRFTTDTKGFGDFLVSSQIALIKNKESENRGHMLILDLGARLPTYSIQPTNDILQTEDVLLPYPMRVSSGTIDPYLGISYTYHASEYAVGGQLKTIQRVYDNFQNYRLGSQYQFSGWFNYRLTDIVSASARLLGDVQSSVKGVDSRLNATLVPTADANQQGHMKIKGAFGVSFKSSPSIRVGLELSVPFVQYVQGVQLKERLGMIAGAQLTY